MVAEIKLELNTIIVLRVNSIPAFAIESDINIFYLLTKKYFLIFRF